MYFVKILFYLLLFVLTSEIYGRGSVHCNFSDMKKVDCGHRMFGLFKRDCPSPYLIQCGRNPRRIGFVSGEVLVKAQRIRPGYFSRFKRDSLEEIYGEVEDGDFFMTFEINGNIPLYKTPLGQQIISYTGYNLEEESEQLCRYISVEGPSFSFKSPKKVMSQVGGLQQTVCYGNVSCIANLRSVEGEHPKFLVHRVACTALPTGKCPTSQECMDDPSVQFEQVAEVEETFTKDDDLRDQIRLDAAMEQIRQDVIWERLEERIEQEVTDKIKQLGQEGEETTVSDFPEDRMKAMEDWINMRRTLLEEMDRVRGTGRTSRRGIR